MGHSLFEQDVNNSVLDVLDGAKSAATVLAAYRHVDAIPDDPNAWTVKVRGAAALAQNLAGMREEAALYRELATLRTDAPLVSRRPAG